MKRLLLTTIGLAALCIPYVSKASLYDDMLERVENETISGEPSVDLATYIHALHGAEWKMSLDDITNIMKGEDGNVCGSKNLDEQAKQILPCFTITKTVQTIMQRETNIRALGTTLQGTVSSFELPIVELPGRSINLTTDLRSIISIWGAGTGSTKTAMTGALIRTIAVEQDDVEPAIREIGNKLNALQGDELVGAIWRYQYGVRLLKGERAPYYPKPTADGETDATAHPERQFLYKRWTDVEDSLAALWTKIEQTVDITDMTERETAYISFPVELFDANLPKNVIVWARIDGNPSRNHPLGDVGLHWKLPLDTVLPSLVDDQTSAPILGGRYPPEPVDANSDPRDGSGLCTDPIALRGYLCRPITTALSPESCDDSANAENSKVTLVHCEKEETETLTISGPDVCRDINWKNNAPQQNNVQCSVNIICGNTCGGDQSFTRDKNGDRIDVCLRESPTFLPAEYQLYKELMHASQQCGLPARNSNDPYANMSDAEANVACCQRETEAYKATCALIARDGIFDDNPAFAGIPYNAETCAEVLANEACTGGDHNLKGCYVSRSYSPNFSTNIRKYIFDNSPQGTAYNCTNASNKPRIKSIVESIDRQGRICTPDQQTQYPNKIGNNLCFIGQCIEETAETLRTTPGKATMGVGTPIAPWDSPLSNTPQGALLRNPPESNGVIPSYKPELLARTMEDALCASVGLPPRTPPTLCIVEADRQQSTSVQLATDSVGGFARQSSEQELTINDLLSLSPALGSRIGTNLYAEYLETGVRSLTDLLTMATDLLEDMNNIRFPTQMCPVSEGLPTPTTEE